jgi:copper chaperone CopZ
MIKYIATLVFAIFLGLSASSAMACTGHGNNETSVMKLEVKKVKSEKSANDLKAQLMQVKGVKDVQINRESGTVTIQYDKPQMGCCSVLHSALKNGGWKYKLVSNEEKPACKHGAGHSHSHAH